MPVTRRCFGITCRVPDLSHAATCLKGGSGQCTIVPVTAFYDNCYNHGVGDLLLGDESDFFPTPTSCWSMHPWASRWAFWHSRLQKGPRHRGHLYLPDIHPVWSLLLVVDIDSASLHKGLQGASLNILTSTQHKPTMCKPLSKLCLASPTSGNDSANA